MNISTDEVDNLIRRFDANADVGALAQAVARIEILVIPSDAAKAQQLTQRTEALRQLLAIFNRIDPKIIPGFDFSDLPSMTAVPPIDSPYPAGVDPAAITDPQARAAYENTLAEDRARMERYRFQLALSKVDKACVEAFSRRVAADFPRAAAETLDQLVDKDVISTDRRKFLKDRIATLLAERR